MTPLSVEMAHAVIPQQPEVTSGAQMVKGDKEYKAVTGRSRRGDVPKSTQSTLSKSIKEHPNRSVLDSGKEDEILSLNRPNQSNERFVSLPARPRWKPENIATSAIKRVDGSQRSLVKSIEGQRRQEADA